MRIAIDTNALYTSSAGVARYIRGLQKGLSELGDHGNVYHDFAWPVSNLGYKQPLRAVKTLYREVLWPRFAGAHFLSDHKIELLHTTGSILLGPPQSIRHVVTLCDLAVLRHPERFRHWHRVSTRQRLSRLATADRIACISQFTADEAMQLLGIPAAKLDVVHIGGDFQPDEYYDENEPAFHVPNEFFLFVGSLEPGKNLSLLKDVYRLAETHKPLPPLMIVGARWEGVKNEGSPPKNWHYLGRQPDEILVYLYRRALALVFPSKYEGFGLPIAEAMALDCPVICSRVASLPEVGGDAALYADLSPSAYYEAMLCLLKDSGLRGELISKGRVQVRKFSWKKCAKETIQVYERAFHGK